MQKYLLLHQKKKVLAMLRYAICFGLQLIESIDFISRVQLVAHICFLDMELMKIEDYYRFCLPINIDVNAQSVFSTVEYYFCEHDVTWSKRKTVYTDGARATVGVRNGIVALIKQVKPYRLVNKEKNLTTCSS